MGEEPAALDRVTNGVPDRPDSAFIEHDLVNLNSPGIRSHQAVDRPKESGFAAAARADEYARFTSLDTQRDVLERRNWTVGLRNS